MSDYMHQWMQRKAQAIANWGQPVVVKLVARCGKGHSTHARQVVATPRLERMYVHVLNSMVKEGYLVMQTISDSEWHYLRAESEPWNDWVI